MYRGRSVLGGLVLSVVLLSARGARAQASGQDVAIAQGLFEEGKRLMQAGKYDEGCPKLVESERLDPAGGTLLAIALCHEGQGKTATAWAEFGVALGEARKDRRTDREAAALAHMNAIEPKLTHLRVVVATKAEGLEVRRDGERIGDAQWGTSLPIDPGEHVFEARAPGKRTWSKKIDAKGEGAAIDVVVPALDDELTAADLAAPKPALTPTTPTTTTTTTPAVNGAPDGHRSARLTWAAVAGGVGIVAAGVGVGFGVSASSKWNAAEKACPDDRCTTTADRTRGDGAGTAADLSTVFIGVGAVGIATAIVLWLTAPRESTATSASATKARAPRERTRGIEVMPMVTRTTGGLMLGGTL